MNSIGRDTADQSPSDSKQSQSPSRLAPESRSAARDPSASPRSSGVAPGLGPSCEIPKDLSSWVAASSDPADLVLGVAGFSYPDLFEPHRLADLTTAFEQFFAATSPVEHAAFAQYRSARQGQQAASASESGPPHRQASEGVPPQAVSAALTGAAQALSRFVSRLFRVEDELAALLAKANEDDVLWEFKRTFVKDRVWRQASASSDRACPSDIDDFARRVLLALGAPFRAIGTGSEEEELAVARATVALAEAEQVGHRVLKGGGAAWTEDLRDLVALVRDSLDGISRPAASPESTLPSVQASARSESTLPSVQASARSEATASAAASLSPQTAPTPHPDDLRDISAALDAIAAWLARRLAASGVEDPIRLWPSLQAPRLRDPLQLVELRRPDPKTPERLAIANDQGRAREGFALTDGRMRPRQIEREVDYCLFCHERNKDACSKGMRDPNTGAPKTNALGVPLTGCPLHERIGEMHRMRQKGDSLAALALICIDNPMVAGTGHRICNDCMRSCVFQKQEPVNVPEVETGVLTDVLSLPWGFEIYALLARWNPLDVCRSEPRPYTGKNVLVVGLGPAGYTLAHHLSREGFGVVAVDALKLEPLPPELTGDWTSSSPGRARPPRPIRRFADLATALDERLVLGFGGVSEYGITVRWDKNFLSALYLLLARNPLVRMYGGVRFGGTVAIEDAWAMGFDHVALAAGAGRPTVIDMKNGLARGIRLASDFLMALQLTGAYKRSALANLQVQLPAIVIGGGLTALDTATELLAYYPVQVEKTASRVAVLRKERGEAAVRAMFDAEDWAIIQEQCEHAARIAEERSCAQKENRKPDFGRLLAHWGGVSVVYRKSLVESPAYRLNHEEVEKALEEGVQYVERMAPVEAVLDELGAVRAVRFERQSETHGSQRPTGEVVELAARTVCIAAGTSPNIAYARERDGAFCLDEDGRFMKPHRAVLSDDGSVSVVPVPTASSAYDGFFTSYCDGRHTVSYYGDNHPVYAGSVVRAMASAKEGFRRVGALLDAQIEAERRGQVPTEEPMARLRALFARCDDDLPAHVVTVNRLTNSILEIIVRAKAAARRFEPGQFYRLHNFEQNAHVVDGTRLAMEGIALTGAWVDKEKGLLSLIVLEVGVSSRLCAMLRPGERVVVMGPTGSPTEIPEEETVLLCGGGLGNAVLFSIARALKAAGARVLYFAGYKKGEDLFKQDDIESASDQIVWCTESGASIEPRRPQDRHVRGNVVEGMVRYGRRELGGEKIPLCEVDRIVAIGPDRMMAAVQKARHGVLRDLLNRRHVGIASVNSPMQCMMKEVCAQCLQRHIDPASGKETLVFSCANQDQPLDSIDFGHLRQRLKANAAQERLASAWLDSILARHPGLLLPRAVQ